MAVEASWQFHIQQAWALPDELVYQEMHGCLGLRGRQVLGMDEGQEGPCHQSPMLTSNYYLS